MINTLIIEDEIPAAERLERLLVLIDPNINISAKLDSIESSVAWLQQNTAPDLIMLDIQLADGLSFEIFKHIKVDSFIIFTTAYDEYAIKAFELNSIDYLLKPIQEEKLAKSISKFTKLQKTNNIDIQSVINLIETKNENYKTRFLISAGLKIKSIETNEIAYFYSMEKSTFLCTSDNHHYPIDFSIDKLETLISPKDFFRINRQFMVNYHAIEKINILSKSRISIVTNPHTKETLMVSSNKSSKFRKWLDE